MQRSWIFDATQNIRKSLVKQLGHQMKPCSYAVQTTRATAYLMLIVMDPYLCAQPATPLSRKMEHACTQSKPLGRVTRVVITSVKPNNATLTLALWIVSTLIGRPGHFVIPGATERKLGPVQSQFLRKTVGFHVNPPRRAKNALICVSIASGQSGNLGAHAARHVVAGITRAIAMSQHQYRVVAKIAPGIPEKMARAMKMDVQWIAFLQTGLTGALVVPSAMGRAPETGQSKQLSLTEELRVTT